MTDYDARACYDMGLACCSGIGEDRSRLIEAHKWLNIAALKGLPEARQLRSELAEGMTGAEIALAQKLARNWCEAVRKMVPAD